MPDELTQIDIDALWLACQVEIHAEDIWPRSSRADAQVRLQRLVSAGIVEHTPGARPMLKEHPHG
jgi:hypothetical protein